MSITTNNKRQPMKSITGLGRFKVLGFNLSKDQLEAHGVSLKNDMKPALSTREVTKKDIMTGIETKLNVDVFTVTVWLKLTSETVNHVIRDEDGNRKTTMIPNPHLGRVFAVRINIENRPFTSINTGKQQFINSVGKSAWAESPASLAEWFKVRTPVYPALRGLANLYEFILAWTNIDTTKSDSQVMIGDNENSIKSVFTPGDTTIIDILNSIDVDSDITALIGVDGDYMNVYGDMILGETFNNKQATNLYNQAVGQYGFKADFQDALMLQTYDPMAALNNVSSASESNSAPASTETVDDLPF